MLGLLLGLACWASTGRAQDSDAALLDSTVSAVRQYFYDPHFHGVTLDTVASYRRARLQGPRPSSSLKNEVDGLLTELHSPGARFYQRGLAPNFVPAFSMMQTRDGQLVTYVKPGSSVEAAGLRRSDLVLNQPSELAGVRGSLLTLQVRSHDGVSWNRQVPRDTFVGLGLESSFQSLRADLGYLRLVHLDGDSTVDSLMAVAARVPQLIVDVRGARGDATVLRLIGWFADKQQIVAYAANRAGLEQFGTPEGIRLPGTIHENFGDAAGFHPQLASWGVLALTVHPDPQHHYEGKVVVIADEDTRGWAELLPLWARADRRVRLVGRPTAGRGELQATFQVSEAWELEIPTAAIYRLDGTPLEGQGVPPERYSAWTLLDIRGGADPDMERAMQLLPEPYHEDE